MSMTLLDGKALATSLLPKLQQQSTHFAQRYQRQPSLAVILVGDDPASEIYVAHKLHMCQQLRIDSRTFHLCADCDDAQLHALIQQLNQDNAIDGILLQLPLPPTLDAKTHIDSIDPSKDVDGFTSTNLGRLCSGAPFLRPCTPWGIMQLLEHHGIDLQGKHALILGMSRIVGRPLCLELLLANATVTCCHRFSSQVQVFIPQVDMIVSAIGVQHAYDISQAKQDAIIIDVGIHRLQDGSICGDIDPTQLAHHQGYLTPVPGGVGPMTVLTLMQNTLMAANTRLHPHSRETSS